VTRPPSRGGLKADAFDAAASDRLGFWGTTAARLTWAQPWAEVLNWSPPFARWFVGGRLNVAYNCVDRHVEDGYGDTVAYDWEGEPGDTRTITYAELRREVCQAANALTDLGVRSGDRIAIYMPMIPETVVAMLACARIDARVVITADDGSSSSCPSCRRPAPARSCGDCCVTSRRTGSSATCPR
jgi:acetyl-CoA synthetase